MANLPLHPLVRPFFIADEEVRQKQCVRSFTWSSMADMANHLNFYARKVMPFNTFGYLVGILDSDFLFPVDAAPSYSTRYITVLAQFVLDSATYSATAVTATFKTSTDTTGVTKNIGQVSGNTLDILSSEAPCSYVDADVEVTPGYIEKVNISVPASKGFNLIGAGITELPPFEGGAKIARYLQGVKEGASILDSVTGVIKPSVFYIGEDIDTDISGLITAMGNAWSHNRRILQSVGAYCNSSNNTLFDLTTATTASWTDITPNGGIYIPPIATKSGQDYAYIRVAIKCKVDSAGSFDWRVVTNEGNYSSSATINNTNPCWKPMSDSDGVFDPTGNGVQAMVHKNGDWIQIEVNYSGSVAPHIYQIEVWEDSPISSS